jgi:hypothetical protein
MGVGAVMLYKHGDPIAAGSPDSSLEAVLPGARASMMGWWLWSIWMREIGVMLEGIGVLMQLVAIVDGKALLIWSFADFLGAVVSSRSCQY